MDNPANQNAGKPQTASIRYVDQPECRETFADSINSVFFDGQTMRIEFGITRMDEMKQGQPVSGRRYPACRLVLPVSAAIDLINKMQQTANALQQAGLVKPAAAAAAAPASAPAQAAAPALTPASKSPILTRPSIFDKPPSSER
jgi:hypothetical protein